MYILYDELMVFFSYRSGNCRECRHSISDDSHDLCHSHAYCARGYQYYSVACATCEDLWERARDLSDPEDAILAFNTLSKWIKGFRKNSRNRPKGQDHFLCPRERAQFEELFAMISNIKAIPKLDQRERQSRPPRRSPPRHTTPPRTERHIIQESQPLPEPSPEHEIVASDASADDSDKSSYVPTFTFVGSPEETLAPLDSSSESDGEFSFWLVYFVGLIIVFNIGPSFL